MNNDKNQKERVLVIVSCFVACITLIGLGLAYFSSSLSNSNHETVNAETATIALVFDDNDNGISAVLNLGESITKKFTLENTGTKEANVKINWNNLVNTYTGSSLTYKLEQSTSENGTYLSVGEGNVPTSTTQITKTLKNGILIPVNTKYYYKLTITLNNLDVNQNSDINASFSSYFNVEEASLTGVDTIMDLVSSGNNSSTDIIYANNVSQTCTNTFAYDGTVDNNLRYVGANPCNYVTFNGEEAGWRIIGVMNNVDDGTGNLSSRIKLVKSNLLGNYSWDTSTSSINQGRGINDWSQADLMSELNGDYLNTNLSSNTMWFNGVNNTQTGSFDYTKVLNSSAQGLIGNAKWNLGSEEFTIYSGDGEGTAAKFYGYERGTKTFGTTGQTCNDGFCPRALSWTGKVALMYPSDYGYAVGGSSRTTCLNKNINTYNEDNCYTNDWINMNTYQWLLSPDAYGARYSIVILGSGDISGLNADSIYGVRPTVYLDDSVTIISGNGSQENPFVLG